MAVGSDKVPGNANFSTLGSVMGWTAILFLFWVILSEKFDAFHLIIGLLTAFGVAWATRPLLTLPPRDDEVSTPTPMGPALFRLALFLPILIFRIFHGALQVSIYAFHPNLPICPTIIRFKGQLPHTIARLTLANFITLTPGTLSMDVEGDEFVIHSLKGEMEEKIEQRKDLLSMQKTVQKIFGESKS